MTSFLTLGRVRLLPRLVVAAIACLVRWPIKIADFEVLWPHKGPRIAVKGQQFLVDEGEFKTGRTEPVHVSEVLPLGVIVAGVVGVVPTDRVEVLRKGLPNLHVPRKPLLVGTARLGGVLQN